MTRHILAPAALALAALAPGVAFAQYLPTNDNSVQIYGRLDMSVNAVKAESADRRTTVTSDTSLIGFHGTEQLGGGMVAYFKLEHGLNLDTGAPTSATSFWNREAFVGVGSKQLGYVEIGEHWGPGVWLTGRIDPFGRQQLGAAQTLLRTTATRGFNATYLNAVEYVSPDLAGVRARVLMQAPEGTAAKNRAVALDYTGDRLIAGMFYDDVQTAGSAVGQSAVPVTRSKTLAAGANYRFDAVRLSAYLQQNRIAGLSSTRGSLLGAAVPIGLGEVRASWVHTNNTGASASLFAVGYTYFLSKRSQLYTTVAQMSNRDRARFALWPSSQDIGAAGAPLPGHDMRGVQVGFRHYF